MLRTMRVLFATLVTLLVVGTTATAFAAPVGWQAIDVTLHTEEQQSTLLVSGELPSTVKLPFEAELAVPAGTQLQWIGEILGGPVADDPALKYVKTTVGGMDVYRFTLTKSRTAQVEGSAQGMSVINGADSATALKWTAWRALPEVHMSVRMPAGAQIVQAASGASVQAGEAGYEYVTKTVTSPKAGDMLDLTFSYAAPMAAAAAAKTGGSDTLAVLLVLAVFLVALAVLAFSVRGKMAAKPVPAGGESEMQDAFEETEPMPAERREPTAAPARAVKSASVRTEKKSKPTIAIFAIIAVLGIGVAIAVGFSASAPVVNGKITKFFGAASPCAQTTIPVVANPGVDLATQGAQLVDAFTGQDSIGDVTFDLASSTVDVGYCESSQSEESVRQILLGTGLVTVAPAPAQSEPGTAAPAPAAAQ